MINGTKILRGITNLLLFGALVLPYVGGGPFSYVLILLTLILVIWQAFRPLHLAFDAGAAMLLASFVLIAIAFALTNRPGQTDFLLAFNFVMFALFWPLSAALQRFAGPSNSGQVASFALAGALLAVIIGIVEVSFLGSHRASGFGSNPIPSSTAALFLGFFALMGYTAVEGNRRHIYLLGPLLGIVAVLLGGSRGPFLAIPFLAIIAVVMIPIRRSILIGVAAVVLVGGTGLLIAKPSTLVRLETLPELVNNLVTGAPLSNHSSSIRLNILKGSIEAFRQSPWIGYGWYMKVPVVQKIVGKSVRFGGPDRAHLHSDLLNLGVSGGLMGLLAYALALLGPIVSAWRSPRDSQYRVRLYAVLVLTVGYACCGAINLLFGFEFMTTFYICSAAIFIGYCRDAPAFRDAAS